MADMYCHKIRLGVVLVHQDQILLVRQNDRPFWVFPGGTLELGEGLAECAAREMLEEINIRVRIEKVLYLADFLHEDAQGAPRQTLDVFMLAQYQDGTPQMTRDENLNDMGFFSRESFMAMAVKPALVANQVVQDWPNQFSHAHGLYLGKYARTD